jgi:osmotically-inducible protein OsmY
MSRVPAFAVSLVAAVAACMGQTKPAPAHAAPPPAKTPAKQAMKSDAVIEATIRAKFAKSKIDAEKFQVHVQGGVATIEGKTDVIQHKGTATRLAKTAGAIAVNNHIQIGDAAKKKAADNLDQGRRRVQVTRGDPRSDTKSGH